MKNNYFRAGILAAALLTTVLSAQNVGIGTTTPASKLTVNGNFAVGPAPYTTTAAPAGGAIIQGDVGIGSLAPQGRLHVVTSVDNDGIALSHSGLSNMVMLNSNANGAYLGFNNIDANPDSLALSWIQQRPADSPGDQAGDLIYQISAAAGDHVFNNKLGIGNMAPLAPLHVSGFASNNFNGARSWFNPLSATLQPQPAAAFQDSVSAIFDNKVYSPTFVAYSGPITASDERLKNVIGRSDSAKDLETLRNIEITDYTMKDSIALGGRPLKMVLAGQVKEVYPNAVQDISLKGYTFIPDIYAQADSLKEESAGIYSIRLAKAHGLKEGDTIRLITETNDRLTAAVKVIDDHAFTVEPKEPLGEKVFVYGKECLDLKGVDYSALSMLNISATQELSKKVDALEQRATTLESTNAVLAAENAQLKAQTEKLTALVERMESLEKLVSAQPAKDGGLRVVLARRND